MNMPTEYKVETVSLYVNGRCAQSSSTRFGDVTNPATGAIIRQVPFCNAADVDAAVAAASAALRDWSAWPPLRRARVMQKFLQLMQQNAKELAALVTEE